MTSLNLYGRPWVKFDAHNPQHRWWFAEFKRLGTWTYCPVRFVAEQGCRDLLSQIQQDLLDYYTGKEFEQSASRLAAA